MSTPVPVSADTKDILLNADRVLQADPSSALTQKQIHMIAVASALTIKSQGVLDYIKSKLGELSPEELTAVKGSAALMAMNNIYYRTLHLLSDKSYLKERPNLRMTFMQNPGCDKVDFELMSTAVSAITGCGMCLDAHEKTLRGSEDVSTGSILHTIKIGAVMNALSQIIATDSLNP
jgi:alkyl hydroperoxide reductase subunit D